MEKELHYLETVLANPERPFVAVLGGAKVSDKIEVIQNLMPRLDRLMIGGAMAYTFFKAMGKPTGRSLVEDDKLDAAREIMRAREGARPAAPAPARSRRRGAARKPACRPKYSASTIRRSATGWVSTSAPHIGGVRRRAARREDRGMERADGRVRNRRVRARDDCRSQGGGGGQRHDDRRRRRFDRRDQESGRGRPHHAHLDGRRRVTRVPGGRTLPGVAALPDADRTSSVRSRVRSFSVGLHLEQR